VIVAAARAELSWQQAQDVPVGGHYDVYRDDRDGAVSFAARVNVRPVDAWPDGEGKRGWGLGRWGAGAWGRGERGLGWGGGHWGDGPWGLGGRRLSWRSGLLDDGVWTFAVVPVDAAGNPASPSSGTEAAVGLAGTPRPPTDVEATAYDAGTDTVTLGWSLSPDDEDA